MGRRRTAGQLRCPIGPVGVVAARLVRGPQTAAVQFGDNVGLSAAGESMHEHLARVAMRDREAWGPVAVRRAARQPGPPHALCVQGGREIPSGHGAPRSRRSGQRCGESLRPCRCGALRRQPRVRDVRGLRRTSTAEPARSGSEPRCRDSPGAYNGVRPALRKAGPPPTTASLASQRGEQGKA